MGGSQSTVQYTTVFAQDGYGKEEDDAKAKPSPASFFREPTLGDKVDAWFGFDKLSADAVVSSCFVTPSALLFARVFMAAYAACILAWHSLSVQSGTEWVSSMVSWTLVLTTLYLVVTVVLTSVKVGGGFGSGTLLSDSLALRVGFVMYEFCFTWSLATVLLFWLAPDPKPANTMELLQALHLHGSTLAFAVVDLLLSRLRFEFSHYLFAAATAMVYLLANAVWFGVTNSPLHGLKWNSLFSVLLLFGVMFGVLVSFVVGALITTARDLCYASTNHSLAVVLPHAGTVHDEEVLPWSRKEKQAAISI